ncbi:MAG TPA: ParB/RepB/Spo0J family partition protein [Verrucomicrobiae bacterium]|nr:ParB/RepB/Spo0J family partition protein [Verrucomicrobiae bacterium]
MKTEIRDPQDLKPLPFVKQMPRWANNSDEAKGLRDDIKTNGLKHPLQITASGVLIDGETRRQAVMLLQWKKVECEIVPDEEANEIILREIVRRRNLSKGQRAYLVAPMLAEVFASIGARLVKNFKKPNVSPNADSIGVGNEKGLISVGVGRSIESFALLMGFSKDVLDQARWLHDTFKKRPDLRDEFEPKILDLEKPMGLGAAKAGIVFLLNDDEKSKSGQKHGGGKSEDAQRQMELFGEIFEDTLARWDYWQKFGDRLRSEHFQEIREMAAEVDKEKLNAIADYYSKLAAEIRKVAKS